MSGYLFYRGMVNFIPHTTVSKSVLAVQLVPGSFPLQRSVLYLLKMKKLPLLASNSANWVGHKKSGQDKNTGLLQPASLRPLRSM